MAVRRSRGSWRDVRRRGQREPHLVRVTRVPRGAPVTGEVQPSATDHSDAVQPQRVEVVVGMRTLLTVLVFGLLVVLAVFSLGTLLSIFLAAVLALGLDPVVGGLVARGWGRARASLVVFA